MLTSQLVDFGDIDLVLESWADPPQTRCRPKSRVARLARITSGAALSVRTDDGNDALMRIVAVCTAS
jgi:hypothetical protein